MLTTWNLFNCDGWLWRWDGFVSVVVVLYQREMVGLLPAKFLLGKQREFTNQVLGGSSQDGRKWLGSASSTSHEVRPFGRVPQPYLGDLRSPWLLTTYPSPGMILQVLHFESHLGKTSAFQAKESETDLLFAKEVWGTQFFALQKSRIFLIDYRCQSASNFVGTPSFFLEVYGCFLKWWYHRNTTNWSFLVGKPMVVGETHHFRKPPI